MYTYTYIHICALLRSSIPVMSVEHLNYIFTHFISIQISIYNKCRTLQDSLKIICLCYSTIYICIYIYVYICIYIYIIYIYICIYIYVCIYTYICIRIYIYVLKAHIWIYISVLNTYTFIGIFVCIHIRIFIFVLSFSSLYLQRV